MPYCPSCDALRESGDYCQACGAELVPPDEGAGSSGQDGSTHSQGHDGSGDPQAQSGPAEGAPTETTAGEGSAGSTPRTVTDGLGGQSGGGNYFDKGAFGFTFTYPLGNGYGAMGYWAGLMLLGILIVPFIMLYGYAYRLGRSAVTGRQRPPEFGDWMGLLKDGLLMIAAMIPAVLGALVVAGIPLGIGVMVESVGLMAIGGIIYIAAFYVVGAVLPTFLATGSVTETYSGLRFLSVATTGTYLKMLVFVIIAGIGFQILVGILNILLAITIIGPFLLLLVAAPMGMFIPPVMFGYLYREAERTGTLPRTRDSNRLPAQF